MYKWFLFVVLVSCLVLLMGHWRFSSPSTMNRAPSILSKVPELVPEHSSKIVAQPRVQSVSCRRLFQNDADEQKAAKRAMHSMPRSIPDRGFIFPTTECDRFKYSRGYTLDPMSEEENDFPIAFSIVMFKDVAQVERLLRAIYRPQNYYCIHIDAKSSGHLHRAMLSIASCFPNVFLASKFYNVRWGELSVLETELQCMRDLLKYKRWKYFINLTGQEFPLKTNWQLVKILKILNGANDMEGTVRR